MSLFVSVLTSPGCKCELCGAALHDDTLDWDDALPESEFDTAEAAASQADINIAIGTSLQIKPANQLPLRGRKLVVINLQATPYDHKACLVIRAPCDQVRGAVR